jgi:probable phosphoglycerate mutase
MHTILLIRHAESQANAGMPTASPESIELTPLGLEQAECIAEFITDYPPDLIVTSSYLRTKQTAEPTRLRFPGVPHEQWPVHEFTYLSSMHEMLSTVEERRPEVNKYWDQGNPFRAEGQHSESFEEFIMRVQSVLSGLKSTICVTVALFSHEQFIRALLWIEEQRRVKFSRKTMRDFRDILNKNPIPNGAIIKVQFSDICQSWRSEMITSHLEMLKSAI